MNNETVKKRHLVRRLFHCALFIVQCAFLTSCLSSKRISDDRPLLYAQTVKGNKTIESDELLALIPQRPNKRVLWFFPVGLSFYQAFSGNYRPDQKQRELDSLTVQFDRESQLAATDPKRLRKLNKQFSRRARRLQRYIERGNWGMRTFGEPPTYYAEADARKNAEKMQLYLRSKGFFRAKSGFTVDSLSDRRIRVRYTVTEGIPYHYTSISYQIADRRIDSLVGYSLASSLLKVGDRFDADKLTNERTRLEEFLRNNGYYGFTRQYILFQPARDTATLDSAYQKIQPVDLTVRIANPPGQTAHPVFRIGDVQMTIARDSGLPLDTLRYNGITYFLERGLYKPRLLDTKISLRPGRFYHLRDYSTTQRQLFLLNQFRFSNVNFTDTTNRRLNTVISATPLDKYDLTGEAGGTGLYQNQSLSPGGFLNGSLRARNPFGGLETIEASARYGLEAQTGFLNNRVYTSREVGLTVSLISPQIWFPGRWRFLFNELNPRTQISVGYTSTVRPDYTRQNLRFAMTYLWQKNQAQQFTFSIADINFLRGNRSAGPDGDAFEAFIRQQDALGNTLRTIFLTNNLFSGIIFGYTYNTNVVGQNRRANFLRVTAESGGTTLNFLSDATIRRLQGEDDSSRALSFFKYLRANIDYRHYLPLGTHSLLALRANAGVVFGYGLNRTAPYEKLFFAGGANSVRAWLPRRLGLGASYPQSATGTSPLFEQDNKGQMIEGGAFDYRFERPGDVLLEGSAELRGRLLRLGTGFSLNGAFFVDVGSVWLLRNRTLGPTNLNAERAIFKPGTFLEQLAVGTGVGLRFDFSFVVLRLDAAVKAYDPSRRYVDSAGQLVDERFILSKFSFGRLGSGPNPVVLNFGIGYPF